MSRAVCLGLGRGERGGYHVGGWALRAGGSALQRADHRRRRAREGRGGGEKRRMQGRKTGMVGRDSRDGHFRVERYCWGGQEYSVPKIRTEYPGQIELDEWCSPGENDEDDLRKCS